MQKNDQAVIKQYVEARRLANECLSRQAGLPDASDIHALACALIIAGLAKGGSSQPQVDRAGADKEQDQLLSEAFGQDSQV